VVSLTFDDGPGPITPALLEFLKAHGIRATFFMEGTQIERYPKFVRLVASSGHEIGNHTYKHFDYHKLKHATAARLIHELEQTESALRRALKDSSFRTHVVRMPYGYSNRSWLLPALKEHGYALVHWSFGRECVPEETAVQVADQYVRAARPGAVFLFHDGGRRREKTLEAVKRVVEELERRGYRFVAAEELFAS
jgi:peptidoglycan-N-acetylglucosamine deacetylase